METSWCDTIDVTAELTRSLAALTLSPTTTVRLQPRTPKSLGNLPTELILEIYRQFDQISQIVALNSTSRMFYEIWRLDPASISSAVLPRSIQYYDATVEIQEAEERQQKLDPYRRYDPIEALERLLSGCLATSPISSNIAAYAAILTSNRRLVRIAQKADVISESSKTSCLQSIGRERITHAFHRIWHLTIKNTRNFKRLKADLWASVANGDDRDTFLGTMDEQERDDMARVVRFLVFECSGKELIQLGVSYSKTRKEFPAESPRCAIEFHWIYELVRVAIWSHDLATRNFVVYTKKWVLYKDC